MSGLGNPPESHWCGSLISEGIVSLWKQFQNPFLPLFFYGVLEHFVRKKLNEKEINLYQALLCVPHNDKQFSHNKTLGQDDNAPIWQCSNCKER